MSYALGVALGLAVLASPGAALAQGPWTFTPSLRIAEEYRPFDYGRFEFRFKVGNAGAVRLVVKHRASDGQVKFRTRSETIQVVNWQAGAGSSGVKVLLLFTHQPGNVHTTKKAIRTVEDVKESVAIRLRQQLA